jgi:negative regulator of genetic competence, sporulation and motility
MDLIRIDDNKMKIMLTPVDMQCYALDAIAIDYTKTETRRAFRHILDDVRLQTGFDANGNQLYVQLYPSREGGCEMFVTKLDVTCALGDTTERPHIGIGRASMEAKARTQTAVEAEHRRTVAFSFDALEHLLCVCRRLRAQDFVGGSAAYWGEEGRYYLLLTEKASNRRSAMFGRLSLAFIGEYGVQQNVETVRLYIREHGCPICEANAVSRLSEL